jgi:hypothetical protein
VRLRLRPWLRLGGIGRIGAHLQNATRLGHANPLTFDELPGRR